MRRKNKAHSLFISVFLMVSLTIAYGQEKTLNQVGTSMANFLKIGVGARASSMGGAFVALSDDISCLYWNPGGLGTLKKNEVLFQTTNWILDSKLYFVGASYHLANIGVLGISFYSFSSGDIEETTLDYPDGTGKIFTASDYSAGLTFARQVTDRFSIGFTVKYIAEQLYLEKASTIGLDVGSVFVTDFLNNLRIGFALSNLGGRMQLEGVDLAFRHKPGIKSYQAQLATEPWDIPLLFRFGLATNLIDMKNLRLTISSEVMDSRDFIHRISFGSELAFNEMMYLRSGYKYNYDEMNLTFGGGLKLSVPSGKGLRIDYSYGDFVILNNYQQLSIILEF